MVHLKGRGGGGTVVWEYSLVLCSSDDVDIKKCRGIVMLFYVKEEPTGFCSQDPHLPPGLICSSDWPRALYVYQPNCRLTEISLSLQCSGIKAYTTPDFCLFLFQR